MHPTSQPSLGNLVAALMVAVTACGSPDPGAWFEGRGGEWVDLTHPFSSETIYWPTEYGPSGTPFHLERVSFGRTEAGYFYAANRFAAPEHGGTHLDAPLHFAEGAHAADAIPIDRFIGPAAVVDVSDSAARNPDYRVTVADLEAWEGRHGPLPAGAIVLFRTGWGARWPDRSRYLGTDRTGVEALPELHFPGLHPDAARWLVEQRQVDAVGLDTPSIDYGRSTLFESHVTLFQANIPAFENVANLDRLPEAGSYVVALPMKIRGGTGGPLRIVVFVPG